MTIHLHAQYEPLFGPMVLITCKANVSNIYCRFNKIYKLSLQSITLHLTAFTLQWLQKQNLKDGYGTFGMLKHNTVYIPTTTSNPTWKQLVQILPVHIRQVMETVICTCL